MNTVVWVLVVTVFSGHFNYPMVPTLEFSSLEKCQAAIRAFEESAKGRTGSFDGMCVRIEK